jgi:hypothetical protein
MTPPALVPFSFESSFDPNDPRERAVKRRPKFGIAEDTFFVAFGLLSGLLLFWKYTIALGAVMLAMTTFAWAMRERSREFRKRHERLRPPAERVRVGATEAGYWLRGTDHFAEASWNGVVNSFELDGYLLVQSWHMPRAYFSIDEMRTAGVYDQIKAIVDARSAEMRAKRAEAMAAASG